MNIALTLQQPHRRHPTQGRYKSRGNPFLNVHLLRSLKGQRLRREIVIFPPDLLDYEHANVQATPTSLYYININSLPRVGSLYSVLGV